MKLERAISLFALSITNCYAIGVPENVILTGPLIRSEMIRDKLLGKILETDPSFDPKRIIYSNFADTEEYIGPVAEFLQRAVFGIKF